jgi:RNA polymerase sigma factor (sigma-70 family)
MNGTDLLAEFKATRAEAAFRELVGRYTNLVYSIARRRVADATLAQEITQLVFIRLAKAPPKVSSEAQLLGWLHRTAVHVSIDLWRSETRRRAREQHAIAMQNDCTEEAAWNEMTPVLDEALDGLDEADRQMILLRFFEQKTMADLGRLLEISEDAAKMRVSRALGRLRSQLGGLGITCTATLLGTLLFERSVEAAPQNLVATLAAIRVAAPVAVASGLFSLMSGMTAAKLIPTLTAAILIGGSAVFFHTTTHHATPGATRATVSRGAPGSGSSNSTLAAANAHTNGTVESGDPNPVKLLQGVRRARLRIASGIANFEIFTRGTVTRADDTNSLQLKIQFEDDRYWTESFAQEYSYVTPIPGGPEAETIVNRADQLPREQAIREGLTSAFPSHHVAFYDGQTVTDYWETDSPYPRTDIEKPEHSSLFIFDPRCLGISTTLHLLDTIQACLAYKDTNSVTLIGKESVDSNPAWHIQFQNKYDYKFDLWIDVLHPTRVLKLADNPSGNRRVVLSRYSDTDLKDPLPIEVKLLDYRNGKVRYDQRFVRGHTEYDTPIDPACWTLEGLHMKVGAEVNDSRNHRRIGYWTGSGLSEDLPRKDIQQNQSAPNRAELLALLDSDPASPAGFGAALWIMTNSPDGPDVQKAAGVVLQSHIQSPEMLNLIKKLERMRPSCSSNLFRAMLDQNPSREVRGEACMALGMLRKDASGYGTNKTATAEAEKLFERVIAQFGQLPGERGYTLAELAQHELSELRLSIGKAAAEIDGDDLENRPMKLSDYRGKVVALLFWSAACTSENDAREFNRLVDEMGDKPFVLFGIHADDGTEKARAAAENFQMRWSSVQDAREGPISKTYNIKSWPTIYLLDRKGIIRYRGLHHGNEIAAAADKLIKE